MEDAARNGRRAELGFKKEAWLQATGEEASTAYDTIPMEKIKKNLILSPRNGKNGRD